jgi:hypothetical protein
MKRVVVVAVVLLAPTLGSAAPIVCPCLYPLCPPPIPSSPFTVPCCHFGRAELFCHPCPTPGCYLPVGCPYPHARNTIPVGNICPKPSHNFGYGYGYGYGGGCGCRP